MEGGRLVLGLTATAALGLLVAVPLVLILPLQPSPTQTPTAPALEIRVFGGEVGGRFGFGPSPGNITSPGPTLRLRLGQPVRIVFVNVGQIPHSFAVVQAPREDSPPLFGAAIGSASRPILPGQAGSVIFTPNRPGKYYYICTVPGHPLLGMVGEMLVEG